MIQLGVEFPFFFFFEESQVRLYWMGLQRVWQNRIDWSCTRLFAYGSYIHPASFAEKTIPDMISLTTVLGIKWPYLHGYFSAFSILFYWCMCLYICEYHNILIIVVLYPILQSDNINLFFIFQVDFAILGPLFSKQILASVF